jgi:uncharacterized secreted repeat protein (TIGR03808 family)
MTLSRRHIFAAGAALAATPVAAQAKPLNLEAAIAKANGIVKLEAGRYVTSGLEISDNLQITGVPGRTIILGAGAGPILSASTLEHLTLDGLTFDGTGQPDDLVKLSSIARLAINNCSFTGSQKIALSVSSCGGRITGSHFSKCGQSGIFAFDSDALEISGNSVEDMGNNGIQVWTSEPKEDGTRVINNFIRRIKSKDGGTGENGNGISIFRAGNVMIANNRVSDCEYSGIRNNSGRNCQILGNNVSRCAEVSIYSEFAFDGVVISNNIVADSVFGISITNFDVEGRLAVCSNNIVRNITGGPKPEGARVGLGIHAEADTLITGNVIENAKDIGISMGYGSKTRNVTAQGNLIRNCGRGIIASVVDGAGPLYAINNVVAGSTIAAIAGYAYDKPATEDLGHAGASVPATLVLSGNIVKT